MPGYARRSGKVVGMKISFAVWTFVLVGTAAAQHVTNPMASVVDVKARMITLKANEDPVLVAAKKSLKSCVAMPFVAPPQGRVNIPHHYLNGSHGPTNPAEAAATKTYGDFETRITAGMNKWLATGDEAEAKCALDQMDAWAKAKTLLDYDAKESSQAWFQVGWTLCSTSITESVLINDDTLDKAEQKRVIDWLHAAGKKLLSFEKPGEPGNNLHYWRALAATGIGVISKDDGLFQFGVNVYREAIGELDENGALPREMQRHERASHYQTFALQPLVLIAEFAARQGVDLYGYAKNGRTIRNAIVFFGKSVDDPTILKQYTPDEQVKEFGTGDYAQFQFYAARFGVDGLPDSMVKVLKGSTVATRIGGNTFVIAGS